MRKLSLLLLACALLAGCTQYKHPDPLGSPGGGTDDPVNGFGFESSAQDWFANNTMDLSAANGLGWTNKASYKGIGCLALTVKDMSKALCAEVQVDFPNSSYASMPNMAGHTISAWVFVPPAALANSSAPDFMQVYVHDGNGVYANSSSVNAVNGNWTQITFSPVANPETYTVSTAGTVNAGFSPSSIKFMGIKVGVASAAPDSFKYTGNILFDTITW